MKNDSVVQAMLSKFDHDIERHSDCLKPISSEQWSRAKELTSGMDADINKK